MKHLFRLALRRVTSKRIRSAVVCISVLLTTVLFMTVVGVSANILRSYRLLLLFSVGTDYHGSLAVSSFTLSGEELREKVEGAEKVKEASLSSTAVAFLYDEEKGAASPITVRSVEKAEDLPHFYLTLEDGVFPESEREVLVNPLFFPDVPLGGKVSLSFSGEREPSGGDQTEFTVVGYIQSSADRPVSAVFRYSGAWQETHGGAAETLRVYFSFDNRLNLEDNYTDLVHETLGSYFQPGAEQFGELNRAYLETVIREAVTPANVFLVLLAVGVVFFCSFLFIYNVYSIALTQDMQDFGLLSVIGATHRQLRKLVLMESLLLFALSLPLGLALGYFIGWRLLTPLMFLSLSGLTFSFRWWIPVTTVLLTLFTLLWSAVRPLRKLKRLTPIATVDYSPAADLPKRYVRRKLFQKRQITPNVRRMAVSMVSRDWKRTVITALSLTLSAILFVLVAAICDYLVAYTESNLKETDYLLTPCRAYRYENGMEEYRMPFEADAGTSFTEEYCAAVEALDSVKEVEKVRTAKVSLSTPGPAREKLGRLRREYRFYDAYPLLEEARGGTLDALVVGIPDEMFEKILIEQDEPIGKGAKTGFAVYSAGVDEMILTFSDETDAVFSYFEEGERVALGGISYQVKVSHALMPVYDLVGDVRADIGRPVLYLAESAFTASFGEGKTYALLVNAKAERYDLLRKELEDCTEREKEPFRVEERATEDDSPWREIVTSTYVDIDGRLDGMEQTGKTIRAFQTVGYSLSVMIFLLGILNAVNAALSSAAQRKREFAMLEAAGMTDAQRKRMLLVESLYGGCTAAAMTGLVGYPLLFWVAKTAMEGLTSPRWFFGVVLVALGTAASVVAGRAAYRFTKDRPLSQRLSAE